MTRERDIAFTPAYELNRMVRAKEVSPVELTEISLRRIEQFQPDAERLSHGDRRRGPGRRA